MSLALKSPAKINLFLRILHKRSDGYHELASLFQAIDLCDELIFKKAETDSLTCSDSSLAVDGSNLVNKAIHLYREKTGYSQPLQVHIEKNIPQQAGLGGGSSNAATTLYALNQLNETPVDDKMLVQWAGEIGSDVAFFLSKGTAYCTGRGEKLYPMPELPVQEYTLVKPSYGLSTPLVYSKYSSSLLPKNPPEISLKSFYEQKPEYYNDLEQAAFLAEPKLQTLQSLLIDAGFKIVHLSGSGTAFFCLGEGKVDIPDVKVFKARSLTRPNDQWY